MNSYWDAIQNARSPTAISSALKQIDISVPPRTLDRTTYHTERWVICRFLSTFACSEHVSYPLSLSKRERPDFELRIGNRIVGIEATEAIQQGFAQLCAEAERTSNNDGRRMSIIPSGLFKDPESCPKGREQIDLILSDKNKNSGKHVSDGWVGDEPEENWAFWMKRAIKTKLKKKIKSYKPYETNYLIIYDNLDIPPGIDEKLSDFMLYRKIKHLWRCDQMFDAVFIETARSYFVATNQDYSRVELRNLWV